ncbi:MAG TPA: amidohydrolase family protein [Solirubrobacteraceae bacterium]|jgi:predicted TIM-barrel fold metal-dependent hydrolase|nr:amidohydrolase family protein [Solirubrobacteraceae bacterium]
MSTDRQIIDLHAHWFPERVLRALEARRTAPRLLRQQDGALAIDLAGAGLPARQLGLNEQWYDLDARIRQLDEHGIVHQLLSWPTTLGIDVALGPEETLPLWTLYNDDLSELVRAHPDRFSGVAVLSTSDIDWSVRELVRAHEELGLIGGVLPIGSVASLEAARQFAPVFEVANELGSHIYFHTGYANPSLPGQPQPPAHSDLQPIRWVADTAWHFAQSVVTLAFSEFFNAYPNLNFQIAMLGGSGLIALVAEQVSISAERMGAWDLGERFRRIYLDTGAAGRGSEAIGLATRVFGASQILFGTDLGPFPSVGGTIANVEAAPISDADRELIFAGNAQRLLGRTLPAPAEV